MFCLGDWEKDWSYIDAVDRAIADKALAVGDHTICLDREAGDNLQQGLRQLHSISFLRAALAVSFKYQLMDLISLFRSSRATDPRDHLFALLGLARDADDAALHPRYSENDTVLQICLEYARFLLRSRGTLEVLYRAGMRDSALLAPSWVPNWYGATSQADYEVNAGLWHPSHRPKSYNIKQYQIPEFVETKDSKILGIKGFIVDTVICLADVHLETSIVEADKDIMLHLKRRHLEETDKIMSRMTSYPTGEDVSDVQWRTLICNVTLSLERAPDSYRPAYEAYRRLLVIGEDTDDLQDMMEQQQPFHEVLDSYYTGRIFGLTKAGYTGMFPQSTKRGDMVAILTGGDFPFVLRQNDPKDKSNYELVGQCYIHGRMEPGQIDLQNSCFEKQDIFLGKSFKSAISMPSKGTA